MILESHSQLITGHRDLLIHNLNLYNLFLNFKQYPVLHQAIDAFSIDADTLEVQIDKLYKSEFENNVMFSINDVITIFTITDIMCKLMLQSDAEEFVLHIFSSIETSDPSNFSQFRADLLRFNEHFLNECKVTLSHSPIFIERLSQVRLLSA